MEGDNQDDEWIEEDELEISINAMNGEQNERTFQVQADILTGRGWVLLDTGSTHNFIKSSLVEKLGIPIHRKPGRFVGLPNGGRFDVVHGIRWLNALGRVIWDGPNKTVEFNHGSTPVIWHREAEARDKTIMSLHASGYHSGGLEHWFSNERGVFTTPGTSIRRIPQTPKQSIWALNPEPASDLLDRVLQKFSSKSGPMTIEKLQIQGTRSKVGAKTKQEDLCLRGEADNM
ncbi:Retrotrans_gag domain-containing protein [Raphanus sativus]|nr:Retrotrans_gag domain-containing protein [Raphanus sativus]